MSTKTLPVVQKLSVNIAKIEYVLPETPREDHAYYLTILDQNASMWVKTLFLYHAKEEKKAADPAKVIKDSMVKLLDFYYPLAGRLGFSSEGKLQVDYKSQGAVFVEAFTDASLDDLGDISKPDERALQLLYTSPDVDNICEAPLVTVQVTKFKCGGFAFGQVIQHALVDGTTALQWNWAMGEIARGLPLSLPPFLDRSILKARSPPIIEFPHEEFSKIEDVSKDDRLIVNEIVNDSFCFTKAELNVLKKKVMMEGSLTSCSTFQLLSVLIWKARTKAFKMEPDQKTRLLIVVDGSSKFSPPLPAGYMGNGVALACATTTSADLCGKPLHNAVLLVQNALANVNDRYLRSHMDFSNVMYSRPDMTGTFFITSWERLPFQKTDFGWGEASQMAPVVVPLNEAVLFQLHGKEGKNINVFVGLPPKVMEEFRQVVKDDL